MKAYILYAQTLILVNLIVVKIIEFGLPAQIYGVGFSILMVFVHKIIMMIMVMGFLVCTVLLC